MKDITSFPEVYWYWDAGVNNFFKGQSESHVLSEGSNMQCDVRKIRSMTLEL